MQHGAALSRESGDASLVETVVSGAFERLDKRVAALCRYAIKLTVTPGEMLPEDIEALRAVGFDDRAIVDANQIVSYYNYVNRVADGLGVELEDRWPDHLRRRRSYPLGSG